MSSWISVDDDRKPEGSKLVLVTDGHLVHLGFYSSYRGWWYWEYLSQRKITHWQPLSAPPNKEDDVFDEEEIHENCTVQIWRNSKTGEESVGWWENGKDAQK